MTKLGYTPGVNPNTARHTRHTADVTPLRMSFTCVGVLTPPHLNEWVRYDFL
jgi:hypothetical protein